MCMRMTLNSVEQTFLVTCFVLSRKSFAWHDFAGLIEGMCSWNDPSVHGVLVLSVRTSLLQLLHSDRMHLMSETQQAMH